MSFEMHIISVAQRKVSQFRHDLSITVENEIDHKEEYVSRYFEIWPTMCRTEGIWYELTVYDGIDSAVPICGFYPDISPGLLPIPKWVTDLPTIESLTPIYIKDPFNEEFKEILECLINESPQKKVLFHARYQCPDTEIMMEVMTLEEFYSNLENKKILFNACYTIKA